MSGTLESVNGSPIPYPEELFCRDCGWSGNEEDLPVTTETREFWGTPVIQRVRENACPCCGHDALEGSGEAS